MDFTKIDNYRDFVRQYLAKRGSNGRGEMTRLSQSLRVHPTFISQVLAGKKDFNMEQAFEITKYLKLTEMERRYFLLLIQKDRSGTVELKNYYKKEIEELRSSLSNLSNKLKDFRSLTDQDRAVFYSSYLYTAIRLYCSIGNGKDLEEICEYFLIDRKKALKILDFLCETNLVTLEKNRYKLGTTHTHLPPDSPYVIRHHMNWRVKSLERHESKSENEIAFSAPMSISKKDFMQIRERIHECIKDSIEVAKASDAEELAFLNIDWLFVKSDQK